MQVRSRVAAWQFMIFEEDWALVDMEYAEALSDLKLSTMAVDGMNTRTGAPAEKMGSIINIEEDPGVGSIDQSGRFTAGGRDAERMLWF